MSSRSNRLPWLRTGLMGLVAPLLPFVWALESNGCSGPKTVEHTGLQIVSRFELDAWPVLAAVLLLASVTPLVARYRTATPAGYVVWLHVLGLVACGLSAYGAAFAIFFTIFAEREATPVGWLVIALFLGCVLDALARVGLSVREWRLTSSASSAPRNSASVD